jgi:PEP-CTERM motif
VAANSLTNAGEIRNGAVLKSGGTVTNTDTITGGNFGLYIAGGGAVTNSGTISGGASVVFAGSGTNTLTLQTGSTLVGAAYGSTASGAANALILEGHGTANNNFGNFKTLNAEGSGVWTLGGNSAFGETMVSAGTLSVTGALASTTLEIAANAELNDGGAVTVTGAVTNRGNLTINGVTMNVVGAGGTFTQVAGGTTTLLNGGLLDPSSIVIERGVFGGGGSLVGDVSVTGGTLKPGGSPGDSLNALGNFLQTGGSIVFDFMAGANAQEFIADGLLNLNTFLGLTGGGAFCTELDCGRVLQDISFADNVHGLTIMGFDPATRAIDPITGATPEPGTWALMMTGIFGLTGLGLRRRMRGRSDHTRAPICCRSLSKWKEISAPSPDSSWVGCLLRNGATMGLEDRAPTHDPMGSGNLSSSAHQKYVAARIQPHFLSRIGTRVGLATDFARTSRHLWTRGQRRARLL